MGNNARTSRPNVGCRMDWYQLGYIGSCNLVYFTHCLMAVMVLLIEKGTKLAKIIDNNHMTKTIVTRRRIYLMRQKGHDTTWIAKKLGMTSAEVKAILA